MAFKDRLKEARLKKNMTQEQLANSVGIAKSTLTGYEKGNREPNMLTVSNIMETLNVDANYLWQDEMGENFPEKLNYDELEHMGKYRSLNNDGRKSVDYHIDSLLKYESELKKAQQEKEKIVQLKPQIKQELHYLDVIAAHNDNTDEDQVEKMRRDAMALLED